MAPRPTQKDCVWISARICAARTPEESIGWKSWAQLWKRLPMCFRISRPVMSTINPIAAYRQLPSPGIGWRVNPLRVGQMSALWYVTGLGFWPHPNETQLESRYTVVRAETTMVPETQQSNHVRVGPGESIHVLSTLLCLLLLVCLHLDIGWVLGVAMPGGATAFAFFLTGCHGS